MKKLVVVFLTALMLTGCKVVQDIKPDTIVDIPLHPTQAQTQPATEQTASPAETETHPAQTEPLTEEAPARAQSSSTGKPSGEKKPDKGSSGKDNSASKEPTKPKATQPPTDPPTDPPTQPPTQPPTEPPTEAPTQPPGYDPAGYTPGSRDRSVADAVNARREAAGLPPLTLDTRLCAVASVRAWEASRVWSESRPGGSAGISVLDEYGYGYASAAQNLYFGTAGGETIVEKWMSSESRKANILMESATAIGVGSYTADDGLTYVAAFFVG